MIRDLFSFLFPPSREEAIVSKTNDAMLREIAAKRVVADVTVLLPYRHETVRALLWRAKYADDTKAFALLGALLAEHVPEGTAVIPVPLHPIRLRGRGFNQTERIAHAAKNAHSNIVVHADLLVRTRNTPRQTELKRAERLTNMKDAFDVQDVHKSGVSSGTPLLLLDDIVTTGTTLREAKQTLANAGYTNVTCLALAH